MLLRWEQVRPDLFLGTAPEGHRLAQVGHVQGPDGADHGWAVWLVLEGGELFDRYPTPEAAQAAAEQALEPPPPASKQTQLWDTD